MYQIPDFPVKQYFRLVSYTDLCIDMHVKGIKTKGVFHQGCSLHILITVTYRNSLFWFFMYRGEVLRLFFCIGLLTSQAAWCKKYKTFYESCRSRVNPILVCTWTGFLEEDTHVTCFEIFKTDYLYFAGFPAPRRCHGCVQFKDGEECF